MKGIYTTMLDEGGKIGPLGAEGYLQIRTERFSGSGAISLDERFEAPAIWTVPKGAIVLGVIITGNVPSNVFLAETADIDPNTGVGSFSGLSRDINADGNLQGNFLTNNSARGYLNPSDTARRYQFKLKTARTSTGAYNFGLGLVMVNI